MAKYTFSRFVYLDTNIISTLAKDRSSWPDLLSFLEAHDLTMGLSTAQVAELADAKRLHSDLVGLFVSVPTGVLKIWDTIVSEEVSAHPNFRTDPLLLYSLNAILLEEDGLQKLFAFLSSPELYAARQDQLKYANQMEDRHSTLKENFPPSKSGKYTKHQADEFVDNIVIQWLFRDHRQFLIESMKNVNGYNLKVFKSIRLFGYVNFYKYYLGQREPKKLSDFGDLGHLFYIPYCELAVMERDLCNILNQIKRNHDILENTIIRNIDFLKHWELNEFNL